MSQKSYILALDQGTTSSRAILFSSSGEEVYSASRKLPANFPEDGWVEQDPNIILRSQIDSAKEVLKNVDISSVHAIGITNQRETTIVWDRDSGEPLAPAIVWQCRRSADICDRLKKQGLEETIRQKTGLVLDPYFSATKIIWLIENVPGLKEKVKNAEALFGSVDSWLLYKLSEGKSYRTDISNASRTMLLSLETGDWDNELLDIAGVSRDVLPEIVNSDSLFGQAALLGLHIPIHGVLGDQQASLFGNGCEQPGSIKCTFGTGAFLLANTGSECRYSDNGLLSTIAWRREKDTAITYALEGSVFVAGSLIQWLRDGIGIIASSPESEELAAQVKSSEGLVLVPAFVGLGTPHWDDQARGLLIGITRNTNRSHICRAALEAVAHQVADILEAEPGILQSELRIDGGMMHNALFCQILADICGANVQRAHTAEMTAYGAFRMAAAGSNFDIEVQQEKSKKDSLFSSVKDKSDLKKSRDLWREAVQRSLQWA